MNFKITGAISILLIIYGYLCRSMRINFFWESKDIGWLLLFFAIILFLIKRIKQKQANQKKGLEKIGIGLFTFILLMQIGLFFILLKHPATKAAQNYIRNDQIFISDAGLINGFSIIPQGSIFSSTDNLGEKGVAEVQMVVKGSKKYIDVTIYLEKKQNHEWEVIEIKK